MLNQNYTQAVVIDGSTLKWEASPAARVWRKKLERQAAETGRATSVVRYEAGTRFDTHDHPNGEEIYVLSGVFSDETGDYPAGSYIRNPAGTAHAPFSTGGCDIFVKLCYFQTGDSQALRVDSNKAGWQQGMDNMQKVLPLHQFNNEVTQLVALESGARWRPVVPDTGFEALIISGDIWFEDKRLPATSWIRLPGGERPVFDVRGDAVKLLVKTGHLPEE